MLALAGGTCSAMLSWDMVALFIRTRAYVTQGKVTVHGSCHVIPSLRRLSVRQPIMLQHRQDGIQLLKATGQASKRACMSQHTDSRCPAKTALPITVHCNTCSYKLTSQLIVYMPTQHQEKPCLAKKRGFGPAQQECDHW
jgi:hypothetical protein